LGLVESGDFGANLALFFIFVFVAEGHAEGVAAPAFIAAQSVAVPPRFIWGIEKPGLLRGNFP
jgi:hypothetical protein